MPFNDFLKLVIVVKSLYGRDIAEKLFTKNIDLYYNLNSESLIDTIKEV